MSPESLEAYQHIRSGGAGYYKSQRGMIAVWGKEAVRFLDGMITNDMKTLADAGQMLAAFPNAQGRLLAVVRVLRQGDRFVFETEAATREKLFTNLFRFTYAGDFFVEDLSETYEAFEIFGSDPVPETDGVRFSGSYSSTMFVPAERSGEYRGRITSAGSITISDELFETLRIENGVPRYGTDMDEMTVVPELGLNGLISYNKGCYIGQEIIARIYFRGHVAKRLTGFTFADQERLEGNVPVDLVTPEGKSAGRITSTAFSPQMDRTIALGYARYDYLEPGTELVADGRKVTVVPLPFIV